jgi:hypothetical protein
MRLSGKICGFFENCGQAHSVDQALFALLSSIIE